MDRHDRSVSERLDSLILRWEECLDAGHEASPTELCADCPELIQALECEVAKLRAFRTTPRHGDAVKGAIELPSAISRETAFGDYADLSKIGRGGMGVVYRARQISLNRVVAIKMIRGDYISGSQKARFRNEAEAVASLGHANIVPIYATGEHEGRPFFTMRLIEGGPLSDRLEEYSADLRMAVKLLVTVADAVHHAHLRGILHRDLKPGNVLIDRDGQAYVSDFGLAKRLEADSDLSSSANGPIGTLPYMSPEEASGLKGGIITTAADVYGLGAVLYAMLTGRPVFRAETVLETLRMVREVSPVPPSRLNPRVARDLEAICLKCLLKEPADRYRSAEAVVNDLKRYLAGEPTEARPAGAATRLWMWCRRKPVLAAIGATMAAGLIAAAAMTVVAVGQANLRAIADREAATQANLRAIADREAATQGYYAGVSRTSALRHDARAGWTWPALDALAEAAGLKTPARSLAELKTEAAAGLTAFDIRPAGAFDIGLNAAHLAYSPDGRILAVAEFKVQAYTLGRVLLIDPADGRVTATLAFIGSPLHFFQKVYQVTSTRLRFSPDGRRLALGTRDGMVWLWDRSGPGGWSAFWAAHDAEVHGLAFDPQGRWLWTASDDGMVKRWDLDALGADGPTLAASARLPAGARDLALGHGTLWVSLHSDSVLRLEPMSLASRGPGVRLGYRLRVSPDGAMIAAAAGDHLDLADAAGNGSPFRRLVDGTDEADATPEAHSVDFGRGGTLLAVSYNDRHARIWDVASGRLLARFPAGGDAISCVAFSPDGRRLAITDELRVRFYEIRDDDVMLVGPAGANRVEDLAWLPGDRRLAWVAYRADRSQAEAVVWDGVARRIAARTLVRPGSSRFDRPGLAAHPLVAILAFHACGQTYLWDPATSAPPTTLATGFDGAIGFSPDGTRLWGVAANNGVDSWSLAGRTRATSWTSIAEMISGMPGIDGLAVGRQWVVAASHDGKVTLLDARDGSAVRSWHHAPAESVKSWKTAVDPVRSVDLSRDGTLVASGTQSGRIWIRRIPSGEVVSCLDGHDDSVEAVALHPSGRLLASGSRDGTVRFWRPSTAEGDSRWEWDFTLPLPGREVHRLRFNPDGECLAILIKNERAVRVLALDRLRRRWAELGIGG